MIKKLPLDDSFVCLNTDTGNLTIANPVGARIHELYDQGQDANAITQALIEEFEAPSAAQTLNDVVAFMDELAKAPSRQFRPLQNHEPDTSYRPARPCKPVGTLNCYLPTACVLIESESSELLQLIAPFFQLSASVVQHQRELTLSVFREGDTYPLVFNGQSVEVGSSVEDTALLCIGAINTVAASVEPHTFTLHAAAVSLDNRGVLFPALGGSGKTTLSAYLLKNGYQLINDDSVHMAGCEGPETTAQIFPIPSPISIKSGSWKVLASYFPELSEYTPYSLGDRQLKLVPVVDEDILKTPVPCSLIVSPRYVAGAPCSLQPISATETLQILINSGCYLERPVKIEALAVFVEWLQSCRRYRLEYSSLADAAAEIRQLFEAERPK